VGDDRPLEEARLRVVSVLQLAKTACVKSDRLTCVECRREQGDDERGWHAYLTTDEDDSAEALVYCPECAEREFGSRGRAHNPS
jgi:hypothetical protein